MNNLIAGAAIGYGFDRIDIDGYGSLTRSSQYSGTDYATYQPIKDWFVDNAPSVDISRIKTTGTILAFVTGVMAFPALAQSPSDAGKLLRDIEREAPAQMPERGEGIGQPLPPPMPEKDGLIVTVSSFRFIGNKLLAAEQLSEVLKPFLGRPLRFADLQAAVAAVAGRYRQDGWVVRVYLPQQEIIDGVVTIQIVEASFGGARLQGELTRLSVERIERIVEQAQARGKPANLEQIERAILLIKDLPGVEATAALRTGEREGETDLVIDLADTPLLNGRVAVDNAGSRSTGEERVLGLFSLDSPMSLGDQAGLTAMTSTGSKYARLDYTLPVGHDGMRAGASLSRLTYELGKDFTNLSARGSARTTGVNVTYPLRRSRFTNVYLGARQDRKEFYNESLGATVSDYSMDVSAFEMSANHYDRLGGGGITTGQAIATHGRLNLNGSPSQADDASTAQTHGVYSKLELSVRRLQALTPRSTAYVSFSTQYANRNLDSAEHFSLGSAHGVRAYPASEGNGDEGRLLTLEWRHQLQPKLRIDVFYDHGWIKLNENNGYAGAPAVNSYELKGAGLAVDWQPARDLDINASWAHRLGSNPNRTSAGMDQDGSFIRNRLWVNAMYRFQMNP